MWSILRFNIRLIFSYSRACKLVDYRWSAKALSASIRLAREGGLHLQPVQCSAGLTVHLHTCSEYLWQLTVIARDQDASFIKADIILPPLRNSPHWQGVRQQKMAVEARMQETGSRRALLFRISKTKCYELFDTVFQVSACSFKMVLPFEQMMSQIEHTIWESIEDYHQFVQKIQLDLFFLH